MAEELVQEEDAITEMTFEEEEKIPMVAVEGMMASWLLLKKEILKDVDGVCKRR